MRSACKIIQIPFCFHPAPIGGTEVYVQSLAQQLQSDGLEVVIAAPGPGDTRYTRGTLPVRRYAISENVTDIRDIYGAGDRTAALSFERLLDAEQPDLVHLHAFTRGVSLLQVRAARQRGIPVVFTYHTPTVSCQRGTLLRWGRQVCDGKLRRHTCARCTLHGLGMNRSLSTMVGSLPPQLGQILGRAERSGGAWTALRMTELVQLRHAAFRALMQEVDHVVVLCHWTRELLLRNGVPSSKMSVSPHGLAKPAVDEHAVAPAPPLRIAFLGRLDPTKGPDLLIKAMRNLSCLPLELHLYGISQGENGQAYLRQLQTLASGDARIQFFPAVPGEQVIPLLQRYHLLAVPSRWLETGPLVILEAFAAGIPVLGSRLGGIADLVRHEVDGLLVDADNSRSWGEALTRLANEPELYQQLRDGVTEPRRIEQVASEMQDLYASLCDKPL
jgi:glycosyltransferase involved in cell wall biosynthesis